MRRWGVVLAGGVGSRFWPLSTPARPKQLLPLVDDEPLLANTLRRLRPVADGAHTLVLTSAALVESVATVASEVPRENIIAEPRPAGTAAALAWAATEIARRDSPDAVMMCVHADWAVADEHEFARMLERAAIAAAERHDLVTVGVVPTRADPGFGYIQLGDELEEGVFRVARFVEKPERALAEHLVHAGYLWNSGIFVWRASDLLREIATHTPEVAPALEEPGGDIARFFAATRPIAIDIGVLERSSRVLALAGDFGWDDVGTWAALRRARASDDAGNVTHGSVTVVDSAGNVAYANDCAIVLYGVRDLVVVARGGLTLVTTMDGAADLKRLVDALPPSLREGT